jgi:Nif-specific regulatory protein
MEETIRILIVDDEKGSRETLGDILREEGYAVTVAGDADQALEQVEAGSFDIALLDIRLPGMDGVELLGRIRRMSPGTSVIMITAYATVENSIEALNLGAWSYLTKPLNIDEVKIQIRRVIDRMRLAGERDRLLLETKQWAGQLQILGEMTRSINARHDARELLRVMFREMRDVIDASRVAIFLLDPAEGTVEEMMTDGGEVSVRYHPGGRILKHHAVGWVLRVQEPLITERLKESSPFEDERERLAAGCRSRVAVPFRLKEGVTGALVLESGEAGYYGEGQLRLLKIVARQLSVALENARMYEELLKAKEALEIENVDLKTRVGDRYAFGRIVVESPAMKEILRLVGRVINSSSTVFLAGESGTGKELIANVLHYQGPRKERPFVVVNCGAIPENLLESELFGYERGAFTGADREKEGLFERADGGTFFLDEVDELTKPLQVKLLRLLQDGEVRRLGAVRSKRLDVRVITATSRDIRRLVDEGEFREDLYYRLHVYPILIPPLRERRDDILPLAEHFLETFRERTPNRVKGFSPDARRVLLAHDWPGNVRELEHAVEKSIHLAEGDWIRPADLGIDLPRGGGGEPSRRTLHREKDELMRARLQEALEKHSGNKARAARELGIHRTQLYRYLKRFGLG